MTKGVIRFGKKKENLSPTYTGPFEILKQVEGVAYIFTWPPENKISMANTRQNIYPDTYIKVKGYVFKNKHGAMEDTHKSKVEKGRKKTLSD